MFRVTVMNQANGLLHVEIKRPFGTVDRLEFTPEAFSDYRKEIKSYCDYKGYELLISYNK